MIIGNILQNVIEPPFGQMPLIFGKIERIDAKAISIPQVTNVFVLFCCIKIPPDLVSRSLNKFGA